MATELEDNLKLIFKKCETCLDLAKNIVGIDMPILKNLLIYYKGVDLDNKINSTSNGTLYNSYIINPDYITFDGGYGVTGDISRSRGTIEIYCRIPSSFVPNNDTKWYFCSCLFGCELNATQQDFGIIIDKDGYFAIGYDNESIASTTIKANDDNYHHLVLVNGDDYLKLYIDGVLQANVSHYMSGNIPSTYGIFWNNDSTTTIVQGDFALLRFYTSYLTDKEILYNYNCCVNGNL